MSLKNSHPATWNSCRLLYCGTLFAAVLALAGVDQGSKQLAMHFLSPESSTPILPGVFQLTLTYNTGAAFSLLHHHPGWLTAFSSVLFLILALYGFLQPRLQKAEWAAMALLLGGALGNLIDRLFQGRVTDFADFVLIHYPVFNVADVFIFCGTILLVISRFCQNAPAEKTVSPSIDGITR